MRALILSIIVYVSAQELSCPSQYQVMEGRCIRPLNLWDNGEAYDVLQKSREECKKDDATLPVIKNDEENSIFDNIANSFEDIKGKDYFILLDLQCDHSYPYRLKWPDGTVAEYSRRNSVNFHFNCVSENQTAVSVPLYDNWAMVTYRTHGFTVFCVVDGIPSSTKPTTSTTKLTTSTTKPAGGQCGDYSSIVTPTDAEKPCFKVFTEPLSWNDAERECAKGFGSLVTVNSAEENKFFWRTAISNNIFDGMHIGAHQSTEDAKLWTWSDGNVPISGKSYDNFVSSFPIPGAGECSSMMTESTSAFWVNENCEENKQPFMCRRSDFSTMTATCPSAAPKAGQDIFPPGFPDPDTPCEYLLFVSANKLVELTVITLVVDENKDFLEILEGSSGPHPIANLTETILTPTKFKTTKSNIIRVNWKPNGTSSGRGFRIRYEEVDT